ncbi:allantoate permease [Aaosphaeria arxii CBS 175.79]|uniref:Allantoate permease n=1 Tax=Aaosphaeria arxii CBS 175.79 TaxID=1450172 RepID=A0A6A5XDS4_9PLEO|nr:allantoate permease [Aaosphaeria arxii CBS 175.79]KAF2011178.1 allantoate permease [Aaosphaeria arxii CBS 175.79]
MAGPESIHDKKDASQVERVLSAEDEKVEHVNYDRIDDEVAKYAAATGEAVIISEEENKRLKALIDKRVLPIMVFTYFLQALDKGTMSFTSIMGIRNDIPALKDTHNWGWLTTCIYIAVLIVEYPTNWTIQRVPVGKYLGFNILAWSTVLCCHAACFSFPSLIVVRTLLGIFEAVCQPAFLIMSSIWYKREEQARVVTYWYMMNGAQQIVGGLLAYAFSQIKHPSYVDDKGNSGNAKIRSWQAIFITYGSISFLWGLFVLYWLPDSPMRAKCFSEEDKKLMVERVRSNQTGLQNKKFRAYQLKEALTDPQTYCYMLIQICTTIPTSGLGAFYQIIIKGLKFTTLETQLLAMVLGAVIIATLMGSAWMVGRTKQNLLTMLVFLIPSFIGTIVIMTVKNTNNATKAGLLISYWIVFTFWAAQGLGMSLLTRNVGGQTKKSICITMNFLAWCAGNAAGPQIFFNGDAPRYLKALSIHIGCYSFLVLVILFLRWELTRRNKSKDREFGVETNTTHGFDDLTDKENPNFRYVY